MTKCQTGRDKPNGKPSYMLPVVVRTQATKQYRKLHFQFASRPENNEICNWYLPNYELPNASHHVTSLSLVMKIQQ